MAGSAKLEFKGKTQSIRKWAKQTGISAETLSKRLRSGWDVSKALTPIPKKEIPQCISGHKLTADNILRDATGIICKKCIRAAKEIERRKKEEEKKLKTVNSNPKKEITPEHEKFIRANYQTMNNLQLSNGLKKLGIGVSPTKVYKWMRELDLRRGIVESNEDYSGSNAFFKWSSNWPF